MRGASSAAVALLLSLPARAVPPLVAGDVPTADKGHVELYAGTRYQEEAGGIERQIGFTEAVYGLSDRQELTFELPYLALSPAPGSPAGGLGDATLGTKVLLLREAPRRPGVAASFEAKLANASPERGLGSGAVDYDLRLRAQKTWGWFTGLLNLGRTFVGESEFAGVRQERRDVSFSALAQQYDVSPRAALLSEIYWRNSDVPGEGDRFAADVGFKYQARPHLELHGSVGRSLRDAAVGGPRLRLYAGLKFEFAAGSYGNLASLRGENE